MKHNLQSVLLTCISSLTWAAISHAGPGELDPSFAGTGTKRIGFGFGEDLGRAVAVQPDDKLVVAGTSGLIGFFGGNFSLVRYGTNDALDPSFGDGGKVVTTILGADHYAQANAVQIQEDGKIVAAGLTDNGTNAIFALVRYHPDGSLDDSFGDGGIVTTDFGRTAEGNAMVIQADGKIILAGSGYGPSGGVLLARYTTNGVLDPTFNGTGKVFTDTGNPNTRAYGITLQADGKAVVAGVISPDILVFRYTTTGVLDPTFGAAGNGKVLTHIGSPGTFSAANGVGIQTGNGTAQDPDKIIVVGHTEATRSHFVFAVLRYGLNGVLDPSFGAGGIATSPIGPGSGFGDFATAVLVQGTGLESRRILVAGYTGNGRNDIFCLARFNSSGALDASFDGDGRVLTSFGREDNRARAMAFVPGGKLVVVGENPTSPGNSDFALARYHLSDGSPDVTFDGDGLKLLDIADRNSSARAVAIQADGKLVVAGSCGNGANSSFVLARFHPTGPLDAAFGLAGKVIVPFGAADAGANAVVLQPDGKIIAAGYTDSNFAVVRLDANGALDPTFSGDGIATTSFGADRAAANALVLQPDGKIVAAGSADNGANDDFAVVRYATNGTLDGTFDADGKVTTAIEAGGDVATGVKLQPDGKIVVAGYAVVGTSVNFALVRYHTSGGLDNSFGAFGRVATALGAGGAIGYALAIQPDAKILVAGYTVVDANIDVGLVRYTTTGALDNSFDGDGKVTTPIGLGADAAAAMALQADGKILVAGVGAIGAKQEFAAVRYQTNGALDNTYGNAGRAIVNFANAGNNSAAALALDATGRAVLAGDADGLFGVARLQGDPYLKILSLARLPNRHALLTGMGVPHGSHTLQGATNLNSGSFGALGTVTADEAGHWQYDDAGAVNFPRRFYRLALP